MIGSLNAQDKIQNINFLFANNGYGFGYEFEKFQKSNVSIGLDLKNKLRNQNIKVAPKTRSSTKPSDPI